MAEPRFLVVRLGSLGDIVHTFPAVAGLRETFPGAEIIWLTSDRWRVLVERSALVSQACTVNTRSWSSVRNTIRGIRGRVWDAAIDYQGLWKSATFPFFGGIKRRIGFDSAAIREFGVPLLYTERVHVTQAHIADQNGELSLRTGARNAVAPFALSVTAEDRASFDEIRRRHNLDRYCVICPGGGWRSKCWPAERYGAVCRRLRSEFGLRSVVNYGPGEEALADAVRAASGDAEPILDGSPLGPLMALLQRAEIVVGGDTGPLHLAVALGARAVALFGPTDPARNGPYRTSDIALRSPQTQRDHTRRNQPDPAMLEISVEAVVDAVKRRLGAQP